MSALSDLQATLDPSRKSWVESANDSTNDFSIQNLPFGIFSDKTNPAQRVGVAIGDEIVDLHILKTAGLLKFPITPAGQFDARHDRVFEQRTLNDSNTLNEGHNISCAWGSFLSPTNPVLRDLTERVVIASKGRFDRALSRTKRKALGFPVVGSISRDEFFEATTDVWEIPAESARRVGHPAPFPVELPQRLVELYTFVDDLVLDPFMGSGTTAVAAQRCGRRFVGYDTESSYVEIAEQRIQAERDRVLERPVVVSGGSALQLARDLLVECGFSDVTEAGTGADARADISALDASGTRWMFDVWGTLSCAGTGLRRTDTLWKAIGKATLIHTASPECPLVLLTTDLPAPRSAGERAWRSLAGPGPGSVVTDVIDMRSDAGRMRLAQYAREGREPGDVDGDRSPS